MFNLNEILKGKIVNYDEKEKMMKSIGVRKIFYGLVAALLILGSIAAPPYTASAQTGTVLAAATPSDTTPEIGDTITVTVNINMSGVNAPDNALGGYTGSLSWNPAVLSYASHSGAPPSGFTGVVNPQTSSITFNGANASGTTGNTVVMVVTFNVIGGGNAALDLNFTAMAAATTFHSLTGILTVNQASVIVEGGSVGVVELDGTVSSSTVNNASSISFSHTTGTGDNRLMLVGASWNAGSSAKNITSVVFAYGTSEVVFSEVHTETATATGTTTGPRYSAIWGSVDGVTGALLAVPAGTEGTLTISFDVSVTNGIVAGVANFKGVDPIDPLGTPNGANTGNTVATVSVDVTTDGTELVFDNVWGGGASAPTLTVNASQDQLWNVQDTGTQGSSTGGASTKEASAGTTTMNWTRGDDGYMALSAVPINPAGGVTPTQYTITASAGTGGSISPSGSVLINQGASQSFTISPNSSYVIADVLVDSASVGAVSSYTFTNVQAAHTIAASFSLAPVTVTFTGTELLGRPTDTSISVKVVPDANIDLYYEYGTTSGSYTAQTTQTTASAGEPKAVEITGLTPNTQYFYRMRYRASGGSAFTSRAEGSFWTQRAVGSTFTVDITTDSHIDIALGNEATWINTLNKVATDDPDLLFDLGDTVAMYDNVGIGDVEGAEAVYLDTLEFFNIVSDSVPVFLTPGNHENQEGWHYYNGADSRNIIGLNAQKKFFLNPIPDDFYSGDLTTDPNIAGDGLTEAYYSFTWGDALFVVINPYWYTEDRPYVNHQGGGDDDSANVTKTGETWTWTLGRTQFDWLKATLEGSNAKYKFVLTHQLVSDGSWTGQEDYGHGGAKTNHIGEWGGYNEDGSTYAWETMRSGWGEDTVHDLMIDNCVSTVFHAHDHQYAYESRDGVIYTAAPSASFTGNFNGYTVGTGGLGGETIFANNASQQPGYIKLTVGPSQATVAYMKTAETSATHTYTVQPCVGQNKAPTLNPIGDKSVLVDATLSFTAIASDDGLPSGVLTFSLEDGLSGDVPTGASIVAATGVFSWTPDTIGDYTFDVCVSDGELDDCETITVTVSPITPPPTQSSFYGEIHYQTGDGVPSAGDFVEAYIEGVTGYINRSAIIDTGTGLAYAINVDGDDEGTPAKDGGVQNDTVIFMINGRIVASGTWLDMANTQINIHPPKADAGGAYAVLLEDASIDLAGSVADWLMSDIFTYEWDFDEDGDYDDATGATPTYTFTVIGTYDVALKVTDGQAGEGFDETPLFVVELSGLEDQIYDGNPHPVTASGVDAPYTTTILYGDLPTTTPPTQAGTYPVVVQIKEGDVVIATIDVDLVIAGAIHEIDLVAGWNMISYNITPTSSAIEDVLSSIDGKYSLVYAWDASGNHSNSGNWVRYDPVVPYGNTLTELDVRMGFCIYMKEAATLSIMGIEEDVITIPLVVNVGGWNLVGYPSATNVDLPGALEDHGVTDYTIVYAYHAADTADFWKLFDPSVDPIYNDLTYMSPGWGFWIFVTEDSVWEVIY